MRIIRSPKSIWQYICKKKLKAGHKLSCAAIGIGIGPFVPNSIQETSARKLLKDMAHVSVRDPVSFALCRQWGIEHAIEGSDLSLCELFYKPSLSNCNLNGIANTTKKNVGIIFRYWPHTEEGSKYLISVMTLCRRLRHEGYIVQLISFCHERDAAGCSDIIKAEENLIYWKPGGQTIASFISELSKFDIFITARYHGAVVASYLNKPFISVRIDPKLEVVASALGMKAYLWERPYDVAVAFQQICEIMSNYDCVRAAMEKKLNHQMALADQMVNAFIDYYKNQVSI